MKFRGISIVALACVALSACGGGGGGSGSSSSGGGGSGRLTVGTTSLLFIANGPAAPTPAPQSIVGSVTGVTSGTLYVLITGTGTAIAQISNVEINGQTGQATVSVPPPGSLGVGTYTGTVTVRACRNDSTCTNGNLSGSPQTINVTYHVADIRSSAVSMSYDISNNTAAADLVVSTQISATPAQSFTATDNVDWLTVPASGTSGSVLTPTIVQSVTDGMTNGVYTGDISVTPGTAGLPFRIPVTLTIRRTQVDQVSPYLEYTGSARPVIIRGQELSQVTIQNVLFGDTPAQSFTVVSDTEIRATPPAGLVPARYPVRIQTGFAGVRHSAQYVVVNPPQYAAGVLAYPDNLGKFPYALVYDAERASLALAVHYANGGATGIVHFKSVNNVWQPSTFKNMNNTFALALAADGTAWIAGHYRDVSHVDPVTLATTATVRSPIFPDSQQFIFNFAASSDGTIAMFGDVTYSCGANLFLYDPRKRTFREPGYTACRGMVGASGDGSRLLITKPTGHGTEVSSLDTQTGATAATPIQLSTSVRPEMDRDATRIVLDKVRVYDGGYNYLGNLPASTDSVIVSPDGTRAYTYDDPRVMRTFDLQSAAVAGSMREIGTGITLAADPGLDFFDAVVRMAITPDGATVFLAGELTVVVQPVP